MDPSRVASFQQYFCTFKTGHSCSSPMGQDHAPGELKYSTMASGAGFAMTSGTCMKPTWCADSSTAGVPSKPQSRHDLVMAQGSFCLMRWPVLGQRGFWDSVLMQAGTYTTVVLEKMPVSSVKVRATFPSNDADFLIKIASTSIPVCVFVSTATITNWLCLGRPGVKRRG